MTDNANTNEIPVDMSTIRDMPRVTIGLVAGILVGALVGFSNWGELFVLHPRMLFMGFRFWTLLSYPFVDSNVVNIVISLLSIPIFGKLLEELYGSAAYARYLAIVTVATGVVCALIGATTPMISSSLTPWFDVYAGGYYGLQPIMMASFVALKQAMPESVIALAFVVRVRLGSLPTLTLGLTLCAAIVLPSRGALPMAMALPVSWVYLRYISSLDSTATAVGDMRDSFSLASFFPVAVQSVVYPVSKFLDSRKCWPSVRAANSTNNNNNNHVNHTLANSAVVPMTAAAREHRAIATELVNQRIESLNRSVASGPETVITFDEQSFADITPIKKSSNQQQSELLDTTTK
jgi:membrane associated rhomboid family serine protease/antitoxin (DNA-binding transcriptional repressor) of toxin-antitoxin stability system